jgi:hypothetical protein
LAGFFSRNCNLRLQRWRRSHARNSLAPF